MRSIRSDSSRISSSVGDRDTVAVSTNVTMLMPRMSGSRKLSAVAPPVPPITIPAGPGEAYMRIAAIPV